MSSVELKYILLFLAATPLVYYVLALFSTWRFFRKPDQPASLSQDFLPPISNLKPVRGMDPEAYENFASFCRQDYPDYELLFCVGASDDPVLPIIEQLQRDFPETRIRILFGSGRNATNDKVAKLARLVSEAAHEHVVISDSDVRVRPDYLKKVIAPLSDPKIGAVTCLYISTGEAGLLDELQSTGMIADFYPGLFVAKQLDGVKFALGPTIGTTRSRLAEFGGYQSIENKAADDLLVGRLISEQGYRIHLSSYAIETVADYQSFNELISKRLRWLVVMRHMRPWGHFGLVFTQGFAWSTLAVSVSSDMRLQLAFLCAYLALRVAILWSVGAWGLGRKGLTRKLPLIVVWDVIAFVLWLVSFSRKTVKWRGGEYYIRDGMLIPAVSSAS